MSRSPVLWVTSFTRSPIFGKEPLLLVLCRDGKTQVIFLKGFFLGTGHLCKYCLLKVPLFVEQEPPNEKRRHRRVRISTLSIEMFLH